MAPARCVQIRSLPDVRFQGLRYTDPVLAAYVGETVIIRYDPRDVSEIRVFHHNRFLCRVVSEEHATEVVSLKDIEAARRDHRRSLRAAINDRVARIADILTIGTRSARSVIQPNVARPPAQRKLRVYKEDDAC